jgi:hypothetical protein
VQVDAFCYWRSTIKQAKRVSICNDTEQPTIPGSPTAFGYETNFNLLFNAQRYVMNADSWLCWISPCFASGTLTSAGTLLKSYEEAAKQKQRLPWVKAPRSVCISSVSPITSETVSPDWMLPLMTSVYKVKILLEHIFRD